MDALAGQGVQVGGQGGGVGLALAGLHFGDAALMQTDAAHDLYGEQALAVHPPDRFPEGREGVGQNIVHGFAVVQPFFQKRRLLLQLLIGKAFVFVFQRKNAVRDLLQPPDLRVVALSQQLFEKIFHCQCRLTPYHLICRGERTRPRGNVTHPLLYHQPLSVRNRQKQRGTAAQKQRGAAAEKRRGEGKKKRKNKKPAKKSNFILYIVAEIVLYFKSWSMPEAMGGCMDVQTSVTMGLARLLHH